MDYVALKLKDKALDQKLTFTTTLAGNLTTCAADCPSPTFTSTQLTGKVTAINAKKQEVTAAQAALDARLSELDDLESDLDDTLTTEGAYIQKQSGGVAAKIVELGVEVQSAPTPPSAPALPQNFRLSPGANAGEVKSACKADPDAHAFEYQKTLDPNVESGWTLFDTSPGCRTMFKGLESGKKTYFRVRGVGKKNTGKGPWSDIAVITVP